MSIRLSILVVYILFLGTGCDESFQTYNKAAAFDDLHQSIRQYGASVESRGINWDSLYQVYAPLVNEDLTEREFFSIIADMLLELRDPHVWLFTPSDTLFTIDHLSYVKNVNPDLLINQYLQDIQRPHSSILSALLPNNIGYLAIYDFKGERDLLKGIYQDAIERLQDTKGLIIDLRDNDGGSVYNAQHLLNLFTPERILWHTTENKVQAGFDTPFEWYLNHNAEMSYSQPVIVLCGRFTISAGERFAIGARQLTNLQIVGDTTANTQGSVMGREMLNGWKYTFTFERVLDPDGINYAGLGIPPDVYIPSHQSITSTQDLVLEKAISLLP